MLGSIGKFKGDDGTVIELASNGIKCRDESYSLMGVSASLEDGSALESRPTLARFLAVGFFAFAWQKKKGGEKYLIVQGPNFTWMAVANRNHIREAMEFVTLINDAVRKAQVPVHKTAQSSVLHPAKVKHAEVTREQVDSLAELTEQFQEGKITFAQFNEAKQNLIN